MSDGLAFLTIIALCVLFAVWARRPKADPPQFTPAEEAPAFKDETGIIPPLPPTPESVQVVLREGPPPLIRPRKNGAIKTCPACRHRSRKRPCAARLRPTESGKRYKCRCFNAFHHKQFAPKKRAA
jgi:hypothetical protein